MHVHFNVEVWSDAEASSALSVRLQFDLCPDSTSALRLAEVIVPRVVYIFSCVVSPQSKVDISPHLNSQYQTVKE